MSRILLIEDDEAMARGLAYNFRASGYEITVESDGAAGLKQARVGGYDLVLLDVMLPKRSGFEVLKKLRSDGNETPVILLTARGEEMDRIAGLKLGADDYVTKPFSLGELLARVEARLRRSSKVAAEVEVDFLALRIARGSHQSRITPTEAELLRYLIDRAGQAVPREQMLKDLWGVTHAMETRTLDNHILRLRKKLERDPAAPRILQTIPRVGYMLAPGTISLRERDGKTNDPGVS